MGVFVGFGFFAGLGVGTGIDVGVGFSDILTADSLSVREEEKKDASVAAL